MDLVVWDIQSGDATVRVADDWYGFTFSNDGKQIATWTDNTVDIFDARTGDQLATLDHENVQGIWFVSQADLLVTETRWWEGLGKLIPSELRFWNTITWERMETDIDRHMPLLGPVVSKGGVYAAGFEPAPRVKGDEVQTQLKIWELRTGRELAAPNGGKSGLGPFSLGFTHSGDELYVYGALWDLKTAIEKPLPEAFELYRDVDWTRYFGDRSLGMPSEKKRATIVDGRIVVWDLQTDNRIAEYANPVSNRPGHGSVPLVFGDVLAITGKSSSLGSSTIDIRDTGNWKIVRSIAVDAPDNSMDVSLRRLDRQSLSVRVTKDATNIVVLAAVINPETKERHCTVTTYDFATGKKRYELIGHNDFVSLICLSPNGRLIATGSGSDEYWAGPCGEVKLWDITTGDLVRTIIEDGRSIHSLAFDNQGDHLAIGRQTGDQVQRPEVSLWRTSTGQMLYNLQLPAPERYPNISDQPHSLAFSPDDRLLAVGGHAQLSLWEMPSGKFRYIGATNGPVFSLRFSGDGERIYLASGGIANGLLGMVEVDSLQNQQGRGVNPEPFRPTDAGLGGGELAISTPNRWIANCSPAWHMNNGEIAIWDVESKELYKVIYQDGVRSVAFSTDGYMVTGSIRTAGSVTMVLDLETGHELSRLHHLSDVVFSPTGDVFATKKSGPRSARLVRHDRGYVEVKRTGSAAGVEIWETRSGRKLAELPHEAVSQIAFSPDGKILASVGSASTKIWQIGKLIRAAE